MENQKKLSQPGEVEENKSKLDDLFTPGLFRIQDGTSYKRPLKRAKPKQHQTPK